MKRILLFMAGLVAALAIGPSTASADPPSELIFTVPCDELLENQEFECHYVSNAGDDDTGDGSIGDPWETVDKINTEQAGWNNENHAVYFLRGDSWDEELVIDGAQVPTGAYRRFGAYGEDTDPRPVIGGTSHSNCISVIRGPVLITDLHADDCSWAGLQVDNMNVSSLKPLHIYGSVFSNNVAGVHVGTATSGSLSFPSVTVSASQFIDNNKYIIEAGGDNDSGAWGILVNGSGTHISGNYFTGQRYVGGDYGTDGASVEQYKGLNGGSSSIYVWGNVSYNDDTFIEDFSHPTTTISFTAEENFIYGDVLNQKAFVIITSNGNKIMQRNTIRLTGGYSGSAHQFAVNCTSCDQFDNNIVHVSGSDRRSFFTNNSAVADYNIFKPASYCPTSQCDGTNQENVDPLLTSATDRHLTSTSPAIDAGDTTFTNCCITTDMDGNQRDTDGSGSMRQSIGADEYVP